MDRAALNWVTAGPRDDWADRYILARTVEQTHDPRRCPLHPYLSLCWRRKGYDRLRRITRRPKTHSLPDGIIAPAVPQHLDPPPDLSLPLWLLSRGLSYRAAALVMGVPLGTFKSQVWRDRAGWS